MRCRCAPCSRRCKGTSTRHGARASDAWSLIEEYELTLLEGLYAIDVGFAEEVIGDLERAERVLRRGHDVLLQIGDRAYGRARRDPRQRALPAGPLTTRRSHSPTRAATISIADDFDAQLSGGRSRHALSRVAATRTRRWSSYARRCSSRTHRLHRAEGSCRDVHCEVLASAGRRTTAYVGAPI